MQTIEGLKVRTAEFSPPTQDVRSGFFHYLEGKKITFLFLTLALAFAVRVYQLNAAGFSEDETNKVFAIRAYEQGDVTVNAEHPMVMKGLCFVSLHAATAWNHLVGNRPQLAIAEETALRLPNVLFGAATVIPLFLLTAALLGFEAGVLTTLLWVFGLNAIWFNRIAKEDTLLLFFMLLGFYFYHQAKVAAEENVYGREKMMALAGAAFGLMLGSKYFPHYIALNALFYTIVGYDSRNNRPLTKRIWAVYFAALVLAFVVCNPAIFYPQTWRYLFAFLSKDLLTHHGYLIGDTLYSNDTTDLPFGSPWFFYWLFLAIKVPLPILVAFLVGLVEIFRHRGDLRVARGYLFLRFMLVFWLVPMTFIGTKFLRYALTLMPLVYMTAAVGMLVIWRLLVQRFQRSRLAPYVAAGIVTVIFLMTPAMITVFYAMPHPSLYINALGMNRAGYYYPHDEFYDLGARESIRYIAEHARPNATIASEIPGVVQYYLERYNRPDIRSRILSQPDFDLPTESLDYVLLQRGRVYFENVKTVHYVQDHFPAVQTSRYAGVTATTVYQIK